MSTTTSALTPFTTDETTAALAVAGHPASAASSGEEYEAVVPIANTVPVVASPSEPSSDQGQAVRIPGPALDVWPNDLDTRPPMID